MKVVWDGRYTYIYTNPDSYEPLAQVRNWTTEDGESRQQTHYFHCDQIGIPREMTDKDSNLYWALQNSQMWADPLGLSSKKSPGTCNDPCTGQDPAGEAAGWQGSKDYPGVDNWKNVVLEKGTILFTLYPHGPAGMASAPGNYFVRGYAVRSARGNARAFNDSVQVRHSGNATAARDMRKQLHIFVVEEDICVGKSKAKANKKYGDGGATQYYIRDMDKPKLTSTGNLRSFRR